MLRKISLTVFLFVFAVGVYQAHAQTATYDAAGNVTATGVSTSGGNSGTTYDAAGNPTHQSTDVQTNSSMSSDDTVTTKESDEKGGTQDINIGVGEMHDGSDGDPDQPVVTGQVKNTDEATANTGVEPDEIDVKMMGHGDDDMGMMGVEPGEIDNHMMDDDTAGHEIGHMLLLTPMNVSDTATSGTTTTMMSGYLKIGDIKGESTDEAKGHVEYTWKVEEGSKGAAAPQEIVAQGGTTTNPDTLRLQTRDCDDPSATCEPDRVTTQDRLRDYVERTANTFEQIREIRVSDEAITMQGVQSFKLFGFIPLHITSTIETSMNPDTFARVKVKLPWYSVLGSGANADVTASTTEQAIADLELPTEPTDTQTEQISLNFEKIKAHIVEVMSNVFGGS